VEQQQLAQTQPHQQETMVRILFFLHLLQLVAVAVVHINLSLQKLVVQVVVLVVTIHLQQILVHLVQQVKATLAVMALVVLAQAVAVQE
jgi:hypothetical protein